jgi:hypothetical protein
MGAGSIPRTVFGDIMSGRWPGMEVSYESRALGMLHELWRSNDDVSALLLLHAHDGWAEVARRRDAMASALEIEQHQNGVRPIRIMADKAAVPLLALDQAIRRLARGNACRLEDIIGLSGRWLHAKDAVGSFNLSGPI